MTHPYPATPAPSAPPTTGPGIARHLLSVGGGLLLAPLSLVASVILGSSAARYTFTFERPTLMLAVGGLLLVVCGIGWGLLGRLSWTGPLVWGLVVIALDVICMWSPLVLTRITDGLPILVRGGVLAVSMSRVFLTAGALMLGIAAASFGRRRVR